MNKNKWVFITGISSGVGKHLTLKMADNGYNVIGISRSEPDYLNKYIDRVFWFSFDLANDQDFSSFAEKIKTFTQRLDVVVLNAGVAYHSSLWELEDEKIKEIINANVLNHVFVLKYLFPLLPYGSQVMFVSSSSVSFPEPNISLYTASKSALESIALSLNVEATSRGLKFKIIRPCGINTDFALKSGVPGGKPAGRFVLNPDTVAEDIILALNRNKILFKSGVLAKFAGLLSKFTPEFLIKISVYRHKSKNINFNAKLNEVF